MVCTWEYFIGFMFCWCIEYSGAITFCISCVFLLCAGRGFRGLLIQCHFRAFKWYDFRNLRGLHPGTFLDQLEGYKCSPDPQWFRIMNFGHCCILTIFDIGYALQVFTFQFWPLHYKIHGVGPGMHHRRGLVWWPFMIYLVFSGTIKVSEEYL